MTTTTTTSAARPARTSALGPLARQESIAYARHPLFLVGVALTIALVAAVGPDKNSSSLLDVIVPATTLGVFGLLVMASLVRRSDLAHEAAGTVVVPERTRTLALACSALVPFAAGVAFFAWSVWAYRSHPPSAYTAPFGGVGDGWVYASLFALGALSALGGPVLGLVVGRWLRFRGAAILSAVVLILVTIVFQGLVAPVRYVRVFAPWTYFASPVGVKGDPNRWLIFTGSPSWYCLYLVALCALGVTVAVLHDREEPRRTALRVTAGLAVVALALGALAMTTGVRHQLVNPVPSPSAHSPSAHSTSAHAGS